MLASLCYLSIYSGNSYIGRQEWSLQWSLTGNCSGLWRCSHTSHYNGSSKAGHVRIMKIVRGVAQLTHWADKIELCSLVERRSPHSSGRALAHKKNHKHQAGTLVGDCWPSEGGGAGTKPLASEQQQCIARGRLSKSVAGPTTNGWKCLPWQS